LGEGGRAEGGRKGSLLAVLVFVSSLSITTSVSSELQARWFFFGTSVGDPDPRMFLGLPDPDPLVERYGSDSGIGSFPFLIKVLSGLK
jgi:hypothetical protein